MNTILPSTRSLAILLGLAVTGLGIQACGGGGTTSTSTSGGGGSTTSAGTTSGDGGANATASTTAGVGGAGGAGATTTGAGGGVTCTEITASAFKPAGGDGTYSVSQATTSPDMGQPTIADRLLIELYQASKSTFDLAAGGNDNYESCTECVRVIQDRAGIVSKTFFQQSGKVTVDATSDPLHGTVNGTITDLTLIEVTVDANFKSKPVPNGACLHLATAPIAVVPAVVPAEWMCDTAFYADGGCDCGCGAVDLDCNDATAAACEYCDSGCSISMCPGVIDLLDNSACMP